MILLDTHALIWYLDDSERLASAVRNRIEAAFGGEGVGIADITLWEIAMLVGKSRLVLNRNVALWLGDLPTLPNFRIVPISPAIAALSANLPGDFHPDPADRLIAATAIDHRVPLVTKNEPLQQYPYLETIW